MMVSMVMNQVHLHPLLLLVNKIIENRCQDGASMRTAYCGHFGDDIGKAVFCNFECVVL